MKKFLALALAIIMVLALGVPALAADPAYSITIDNSANETVSIVGKTYTAYKLFDVTYTDSDASAPHSYTIDRDGDGAWAWGKLTEGLTADAKGVYTNAKYGLTFTPSAQDSTVYSVTSTMDATKARTLADDLQPLVTATTPPTAAGSVTAEDEIAVIALNEPGYFVVYGTAKANDPDDGSQEVVAAVALTTADPTETVKPKVEVPPLNKKITGEHVLDDAGQAATAQIGSVVSFELDSKVPDLTGYTKYTFIITDTMSDGLTFVDPEGEKTNDVVVTIAGVDKTSVSTISISGQTLTVTIPFDVLKAANKNDPIVVTYSATLNDNALTTDYEKNTAKLTYSHSPYDDSTNETEEKEVYVVDVDLDIKKVKETEAGESLAGATFKVFKGDTTPADTALAWYKWDDTAKKVTWVAKADADLFTSTAAGKLDKAIQGLEAEKTGTKYGLLEIDAPTGYNPLPEPIIVTLTGAYDDNTKTATITANNAVVTDGTISLGAAPNDKQPVATSTVVNKSGTELPSTGGIGTTIFYVLGGLLVAFAVVLLITKTRMSKEQ